MCIDLQCQVFSLLSRFQDGSHDGISHRKVLSSGECTQRLPSSVCFFLIRFMGLLPTPTVWMVLQSPNHHKASKRWRACLSLNNVVLCCQQATLDRLQSGNMPSLTARQQATSPTPANWSPARYSQFFSSSQGIRLPSFCVFLCFWCISSCLFCVVSTSAGDCLERLVSEMTYYV